MAIKALDDVLKSVLSAFKFDGAGYRGVTQFGGSSSLISVIDEGLRAREMRTDRIDAGLATEDDFAFLTRRI